jgi:hypothetical protein
MGIELRGCSVPISDITGCLKFGGSIGSAPFDFNSHLSISFRESTINMTQLVWEPLELTYILGVSPNVEEYEISHLYVVSQPPIRLEIMLWQYDGNVKIKLFVEPFESEVLDYTMTACPGVRAVNDKRGKFLEFAAANTFTGRYDGYSVIPYGLRLWVTPQIRLDPFTYPT